jgi:hypothetical protein
MTALADLVLPPIMLWVGGSAVLYLLVSLIGTLTKTKLPGIPPIGYALLVVAGAFLIGAMFLGLGLIVLLIGPVLAFVIGVLRKRGDRESQVSRVEAGLAFVIGICMVVLVASAIYGHVTRTPADYVLKWRGSGPARGALTRLCAAGTGSLPQLRRIAIDGYPTFAAQAADAIGRIGEKETDVPVLIQTLEKVDGDAYATPIIEQALKKLSGIDLPEGSRPDEWRRQWEEEFVKSDSHSS